MIKVINDISIYVGKFMLMIFMVRKWKFIFLSIKNIEILDSSCWYCINKLLIMYVKIYVFVLGKKKLFIIL